MKFCFLGGLLKRHTAITSINSNLPYILHIVIVLSVGGPWSSCWIVFVVPEPRESLVHWLDGHCSG